MTVADSDDILVRGYARGEEPGPAEPRRAREDTAGFFLPEPGPYLLVTHCLPQRAMGKDDTGLLRGVQGRRLPATAAVRPGTEVR